MFGSKPKEDVEAPEPNLATKPADRVGYCFGFACTQCHAVSDPSDVVNVSSFGDRRVCQVCGSIARVAIAQRTAEARWQEMVSGEWFWSFGFPSSLYNVRAAFETVWTSYEFVKFVEPVEKEQP